MPLTCCPENPIIASGECQESLTIEALLVDVESDTIGDPTFNITVDGYTICPELNKVLVQGTVVKCIPYTTRQGQEVVQREEKPFSCCVELQVPPFGVLVPEDLSACIQGEVVCFADRAPVDLNADSGTVRLVEDLCIRICVGLSEAEVVDVCGCPVTGVGQITDTAGDRAAIGLSVCPGCTPQGSTINYNILGPGGFHFISINSLIDVTCDTSGTPRTAEIEALGRLVQQNTPLRAVVTVEDFGPANDRIRVQLFELDGTPFYDSGLQPVTGNLTVHNPCDS